MSAPPPSFSSFPPAFGSFPDLEAGSSTAKPLASSSRVEEQKSKSKKDSRHDRERSRRKERAGRDDDRREKEKKSKKHRKDREPLSDDAEARRREAYAVGSTADLASHTFYSDRKGDQMNITYGGLHAGDVPRYHMVAKGRHVLGLNDAYMVVHRSNRGVEIALRGYKRRLPELTDPATRRLLQAPPKRRLIAGPGHEYKYEEVDGFLRLPKGRQTKKTIEEYREIAIQDQDSDASSDSSAEDDGGSSEDDSDTLPLDARQATLKELEEQLASEPTSIPTWLSLLTNSLSTVPLESKNAPKARAEIALSVLSRALSAHPDNKQSIVLRLRYLSVGEELWDNKKLYSEWEDALKTGGPELWMQWLDWRIRVSQNGVEGAVEDAQRVFAALDSDEVSKLRILWRVAVAFRDAGYTERAMALLQAQAELTFKRPADLASAPFETILDRLETFWESEVPRLGEPNASGWATWESTGSPDAIPIPTRAPARTSSSSDPYTNWSTSELSTDRTSALPLRSFDDEASHDPYASVLFADVRPLLVRLTHSGAQRAFRLLWLSFLGLHVPGFAASLAGAPGPADERWCAAHLASDAFWGRLFPEEADVGRVTADAYAGVVVGRERSEGPAFGPVKGWAFEVLGAVDTVAAGRCRLWTGEDARGVNVALVREVFRQCRLADGDTEWDPLHLAFEGAVDPKAAIKVSKSLVAKAQDSLPHWRAHAYLERLRGRADDVRKIYHTVLSASPNAPGAAPLWWDWAETEWLAGANDAALRVVLRATGTSGAGGVVVLRAKRELDDMCRGVEEERWKEREAWVNLRALLELLTGTPGAALGVFDAMLGTLESGSEVHESMTVAALSMVYTHGTVLRNTMPPGILRERAQYAVRLYPDNTIILAIFLEAERGHGVWGQVKHVLGGRDPSEKDIMKTLAEIWAAGWAKGSWRAEEERIRSRLSAAVQNYSNRGSAILWRIYIDFEIRTGQLKRAKMLLFRAIRECPMVKALYLVAFGPLRKLFSTKELNELGDTMAERGIRMRRSLDEAVEGWVDADATQRRLAREGDSDGGEEEIEYNAQELRRLRPY